MARLTKLLVQISLLIDAIVFHLNICWYYAGKLFRFLIHGTTTWMYMLWKLCVFASILMPGWYRMVSYWVWNPLIIRNIEYGDGVAFRNVLDIYLPSPVNPSKENPKGSHDNDIKQPHRDVHGVPVVILVSGGAWIIGYKLWSALIARGIAHLGVVVVVPDYRNFPQGDIEDMMADIRHAVHWTIYNAHSFGGNANKIVLAGQSAGAHISLCMLVEEYFKGKASGKTGEQGGVSSVDFEGVVSTHDKNQRTASTATARIPVFLRSQREVDTAAAAHVPLMNTTLGESDWARSFENEELNPHVWRDVRPDAVDIQAPHNAIGENINKEDIRNKSGSNSSANDLGSFYSPGIARQSPAPGTPASVEPELLTPDQSSAERHRSVSSAIIGNIDKLWRQSVDVLDPQWRQELQDQQQQQEQQQQQQNSRPGQSSSRALYSPELDRPLLLQSMSQTTIGSMETQLEAARAATGVGVGNYARSCQLKAPSTNSTAKAGYTSSATSVGTTFSTAVELSSSSSSSSNTVTTTLPDRQEVREKRLSPLTLPLPSLADSSNSSSRSSKETRMTATATSTAVILNNHSVNIFDHVKLFVGISGPYNLSRMADHFHSRGLDSSILNYMCRDNVAKYSPSERLAAYSNSNSNSNNNSQQQQSESASFRSALTEKNASFASSASAGISTPSTSVPSFSTSLYDFLPVVLIHGSDDITLPTTSSTELADVLRAGGAAHGRVIYREYEGWTHTDAIVEGPLAGNMRLAKDVVGFSRYFTSFSCEEGIIGSTPINSSSTSPTTPTLTSAMTATAGADVKPTPVIVACSGKHNCGDNIVGERQPDNRLDGSWCWWKLPSSFSADVDESLSMVHPSLVAIARRCNPF